MTGRDGGQKDTARQRLLGLCGERFDTLAKPAVDGLARSVSDVFRTGSTQHDDDPWAGLEGEPA